MSRERIVTRCRHCREVVATTNYWRTCDRCLAAEYDLGENKAILDEDRIYHLGGRAVIHTLVSQDGTDVLWFMNQDSRNAPCQGIDWPAHELAGRLPEQVRVKMRRSRCGRLTRSGKPCLNGPWCRYHRRTGGATT